MSNRSLFLLILLGMALFISGLAPDLQAQQPLIQAGALFPEVKLKTPLSVKDRAYLGLSDPKEFAVKDIKAKVILVEIMNVYCVSCQNLAPIYNRLFTLIHSDPRTRNRIKIIGVSAGNNDQEVKIFRDHFRVPFPIIPDPRYVLHAAIGGSPTPFSIFVRRESRDQPVVVDATHLGYDENYTKLFGRLKSLMNRNLAEVLKKGETTTAKILKPKPPLNEEEIQTRIKTAFTRTGGRLTGFDKVVLGQGREVYAGLVEKEGQAKKRLFAQVVGELPACDVCHDTHFIYTFEESGKILDFIPLQLAKYGNAPWNEADVAQIGRKIIGRYIYNPFSFDGRVDAVTSATITSAAIFKGLNEGQILFKELRERGLI
ncbi:MAG: hypothetical protein HY787_08900 [Deltaproteobacteria bacterium]|nr:hypothetical protein [Deltaproteobacteria bacterium]